MAVVTFTAIGKHFGHQSNIHFGISAISIHISQEIKI